ncbi:MAG: hypothetical protein ACTHME_03955, partial [Candidatus Nitrosocosmicus sp.]
MSYKVKFDNVQSTLNEFSEKMKQLESNRETLIKETREVTLLCSKSIILLHQRELSEAEILLNKSS